MTGGAWRGDVLALEAHKSWAVLCDRSRYRNGKRRDN